MRQHDIRNNSGMTLVELMVAVALFVGLMVISVAVFGRSVDHQETTTASKNLQEGLQAALSHLATEAALAREELGGCGGATDGDRFFYKVGDTLYFRNRDNVCVHYLLWQEAETSRLKVEVIPAGEGFLTPIDVSLSGINFMIDTSDENPTHSILTISITGSSANGDIPETLTLETSVAVAASPFACGTEVTDRDGYEYETAAIGGQCWMAQSLRTKSKPDGTCINGGLQPCADASPSDDGLGRSCYGNDEENCDTYGGLYAWPAAMNGSLTPGDQGICPPGWHIPRDVDWFELEQGFADSTCDPERSGVDCADAGMELKEEGSSDFAGKMGGWRDADGSTFSGQGSEGRFWSSNISTSDVRFRMLDEGNDGVHRDVAADANAYSVRCIKD